VNITNCQVFVRSIPVLLKPSKKNETLYPSFIAGMGHSALRATCGLPQRF